MTFMTAERQETNEGSSVNAQPNSLESGSAGRREGKGDQWTLC